MLAFTFMAASFCNHLYLRADPLLVEHYRHLLFEQNAYNWLRPTLRGASVKKAVVDFACRLVFIFRPLFPLTLLITTYSSVVFVGPLWQIADQLLASPALGALAIVAHLLNLLLFTVAFFNILYMAILATILGMTGLKALYIHALQHLELLEQAVKIRKAKQTSSLLRQFISHDNVLFRYIFLADGHFSGLLLTFLLIATPISATLSMKLLLARALDQLTRGYILVIVVETFIGILGVHLYIALFTKKLYRSGKYLLTMKASSVNFSLPFWQQLQLLRAIERLHSNVKDGIHYGTLGQEVNMMSFAQVSGYLGYFSWFKLLFVLFRASSSTRSFSCTPTS